MRERPLWPWERAAAERDVNDLLRIITKHQRALIIKLVRMIENGDA